MGGGDGPPCIPGTGCEAVVKMSKEFSTFMATARQSMREHAEQSSAFWKSQQEDVENISVQFQECLSNAIETDLKFKDGHHKMKQTAIDLVDHEEGKYGPHAVIDRNFGYALAIGLVLSGCVAVLCLFVAIMHPEFFEALGKWAGIK